jgi:hypothetical protein
MATEAKSMHRLQRAGFDGALCIVVTPRDAVSRRSATIKINEFSMKFDEPRSMEHTFEAAQHLRFMEGAAGK